MYILFFAHEMCALASSGEERLAPCSSREVVVTKLLSRKG
ncbi:hypothetical protein BVRB_5g109490 [Beta vulgaris subsp. vulgaris]|nr:hypothetical protein BVRB_5g109490 [Beta vulgaris subsp. vulgaris]